MDGDLVRTMRRFPVPFVLAALVIGIALGLGLGWQVFPVRWHDTDPADLRVVQQEAWVIMVADSLTVSGNVEVAAQRLRELTDADTDWQQISNLVDQVIAKAEQAGDDATALRARRLAQAAALPQGTGAAFETPNRGFVATPRGLLLILAVMAFAAALAMVLWLAARLLRRVPWGRGRETAPSADRELFFGTDGASEAGLTTEDDQGWEGDLGSPEDQEEQPFDQFFGRDEPERPTRPRVPPTEASTELGQSVPGTVVSGAGDSDRAGSPLLPPVGRRLSPLAPSALGRFEALYEFGDDDFDCSFSIESPDGEFLGECGVGISDVLSADDVQHVDAFEIWLFDKGDIRTVSRVLVSEFAFRDTDLHDRLTAKGDLVMAQPGLVISLETLSLQVTATIRDYSYLSDEQTPNSAFSRLSMDLLAEGTV